VARLYILLFSLLLPYQAIAEDLLPIPKNETEARNVETMRLWLSRVWAEGQLELVPKLVAAEYVRHGPQGTRVVTPESYSEEIAAGRKLGLKFVTHSTTIDGDMMWGRFSTYGTSPSGEKFESRNVQIYRFERGKLAETWSLNQPGTAWEDQ